MLHSCYVKLCWDDFFFFLKTTLSFFRNSFLLREKRHINNTVNITSCVLVFYYYCSKLPQTSLFKNNVNLLSYNSIIQKSVMGNSGIKSHLQGWLPFWSFYKNLFPCHTQLLKVVLIPWLVAPSPIFKASQSFTEFFSHVISLQTPSHSPTSTSKTLVITLPTPISSRIISLPLVG